MKETIVIVETDSEMVRRYEEWLSEEYILLFASSGNDAISLASRYTCDVLIAQQFCEDMELHELIAGVIERHYDAYVIITTNAFPTEALQQTLMVAGAEGILYKPFSPLQLSFILRRLIQHRPKHKIL